MLPAFDAGARAGGRGVEALIKKHGDDIYVFAVNVDKEPRRFEMPLEDLPPVNRVRTLYGLADSVLEKGRLVAELEPLGMAVYRLEMAGIKVCIGGPPALGPLKKEG